VEPITVNTTSHMDVEQLFEKIVGENGLLESSKLLQHKNDFVAVILCQSDHIHSVVSLFTYLKVCH